MVKKNLYINDKNLILFYLGTEACFAMTVQCVVVFKISYWNLKSKQYDVSLFYSTQMCMYLTLSLHRVLKLLFIS